MSTIGGRSGRLVVRWGMLASVLVALGAPGSSWAGQPKAGPAPAAKPPSDYQRHLDAGAKLFEAGQFEASIPEFEAAYAAEPQAAPLVNVALAYEKLDRPEHPHPTAIPNAIARLKLVQSKHTAGLPANKQAWIVSKLAALTPLVGELEVRATPKPSKLYVGSVAVELSEGTPLAIRSGTWQVRAELDGYAPAQGTTTITSGARSTLELALTPTTGELTVTPTSEASYVDVDGGSLQQGRWQGRLSAGTHEVRILEPGKEPRTIQLVVVAGKSFTVTQQSSGELASDAPTLAPTKPATSPADEPASDEPGTTGFELLGLAAILTHLHLGHVGPGETYNWDKDFVPLGAALGIEGGYRAIDWLGVVARIEFNSVWGDGTLHAGSEPGGADLKPANYSMQTVRLQGGLRAVYPPGELAALVMEGTVGGAFSSMQWTAGDPVDQCITHYKVVDPSGAHDADCVSLSDANGLDFLAGLDFGLELDFGPLFLDVVLQSVFQAARGLKPDGANGSAFDDRIQWFLGPAIRPGYRFF